MVPSTRPKTRNLLVGNGSSNFMAAVSIVAARFFTYEALDTLEIYIYTLSIKTSTTCTLLKAAPIDKRIHTAPYNSEVDYYCNFCFTLVCHQNNPWSVPFVFRQLVQTSLFSVFVQAACTHLDRWGEAWWGSWCACAVQFSSKVWNCRCHAASASVTTWSLR